MPFKPTRDMLCSVDPGGVLLGGHFFQKSWTRTPNHSTLGSTENAALESAWSQRSCINMVNVQTCTVNKADSVCCVWSWQRPPSPAAAFPGLMNVSIARLRGAGSGRTLPRSLACFSDARSSSGGRCVGRVSSSFLASRQGQQLLVALSWGVCRPGSRGSL